MRYAILFLIFVWSLSTFHSQNQSIDLKSSWQFKQVDKTDWLPAKVPGNVFTDLLTNKIIMDPYYADNLKESRWVEKKDWEYKTIVQCDAILFKNQYIDLVFEGLDTHASVYLNDSLILKANNMFRSWKKEVKKILHPGSNNLRVVFQSAVAYGQAEAAKLPYVLPEEERIYSRKAQFQYGWDFAPRFVGCGVWKPIKLFIWNDIKINSVNQQVASLTDSVAKLNFIVETFCETAGDYSMRLSHLPKLPNDTRLIEQSYTKNFKKGINTDTLKLTVLHPKLWWCNGMGEAYLYDFDVSIRNKKHSVQSIPISVGIRTLELVKEMDTDGISFNFKLNDIPVFMKGANYVPDDMFLHPKNRETYVSEIDRCKNTHMNMLRVWGGGIYEDDLFYDACDAAGILVWQDLMFACAMYPGDTNFLNNAKQEVQEQIIRLRNHASLALWCGNNEIDEAWNNWGWQKQYKYNEADSLKIWQDYENLFHASISKLMQNYNSDKVYWPSSPSVGWGHKESLNRGDSHYWGVWWGMEPFEVYQKKIGRFMSEYGFQSLPALSSFKKFCPDSNLNINSASVKAHQKHQKGFQTIQTYLERSYKTPQAFGDYIYVSQLLQRDGMQIAIDAHRRNKPRCMGTLFWQLNDCWPATSWSSVDYYKQPKAFYYALHQLYKTQAISVTSEQSEFVVHVVSDSVINSGAKLSVTLLNFKSEILWQKNYPAMLSNKKVFKIKIPKEELPAYDTLQTYLKINLNSMTSELATKHYFFTQAKNMSLSRANIHLTLLDSTTLELTSDVFAKDVYIVDEKQDLIFSDNFFNLEVGQKKRIQLISKDKKLNSLSLKVIVLNNL